MGPIKAARTCIPRVFQWAGCASRSEYLWFTIMVVSCMLAISVLDILFVARTPDGGPLTYLTDFLLILFTLSVQIRRMHDVGYSGWVLFLPIAGFALGIAFGAFFGPAFGQPASVVSGLIIISSFLFVWGLNFVPSQPGASKYGPNPHEVAR